MFYFLILLIVSTFFDRVVKESICDFLFVRLKKIIDLTNRMPVRYPTGFT